MQKLQSVWRSTIFIFVMSIASLYTYANHILIPMDEKQKNHLKAYGIAFWTLQNGGIVDWLLNFRGGSFMMPYNEALKSECKIRGVSFEVIVSAKVKKILSDIYHPESNQDVVKLEKAPKIVVYTPNNKLPWDDAVTLVLSYAEIPYDKIYDKGVLEGQLKKYDWLHLHHEDFTGQYGKFWVSFRNQHWYKEDVNQMTRSALQLGFNKVSKMKLAVAQKIKDYVINGGFMFAMCTATDSFDIALAAEKIDMIDKMFDGDGYQRDAQKKIDYTKSLAFKDYVLELSPYKPEFSDLDTSFTRPQNESRDFFTLFDFSAKWDIVPTMLTQNHERIIKGFMGLTTAFKKKYLKPYVLVLGETQKYGEVRYIHSLYGKGQFSFLGGHDPEDYQHFVGDPPTNLKLHPNSPGYRLILNNVLFPAAKKKKKKT